MEKKSKKTQLQAPEAKDKKLIFDIISDNAEAEIRIGIALADEEVSNESRKRRIEAPPTFEEKIFMHSVRS